jgi:uncharacterized membrane protein
VILAAAFCGWVLAISLPIDGQLPPTLQWVNTVSFGWIGFYCIYNSLRRRRHRSTRPPDQEVAC